MSLVDILQVYAHEYVQKAIRFNLSIDKLGRADIWQDHEHRVALSIQLEELAKMCEQGELPMTKMTVDHVLGCFRTFDSGQRDMAQSLSSPLLMTYLSRISSRLVDELSTKLFFQVPHSRKAFFESPLDHWKEVTDRFPEAIVDVEEMGKCFAFSRYAASVFHSVQVIEHGLIHIGKFLSVNDPISGWTAVASALKKVIDKKYGDRTDFEKKNFVFIEQMQGTVEALKNAWRNKISHAHGKLVLLTSEFSPDVSEEIMTASRGFMRRLATELPK